MIVPVVVGVGAYAMATQPHAQRHELRVGTTGSSTEPCSETTLSAEEIHDRLRAGAGHDAHHRARAEIQQLAGKYAVRLAAIELLTKQLGDSWVGRAADGAARYSRPAADAVQSSRARLDDSAVDHGPLDRQDTAYETVLLRVVPLGPKPESDVLNTLNPFETDTDRAIKKYNHDAAQNIAAYADYHTESGANGRAMPHEFPVPPPGPGPGPGPRPEIVVVPARGVAGGVPGAAHSPVPEFGTGSGPLTSTSAGAGAGSPTWTTPVHDGSGSTAAQSRPADAGRLTSTGPAGAPAPVLGGAGASGSAVGGLFARPGDGGDARRPGSAGGAVESVPRAQGGGPEPRARGLAGSPGVERGGPLGGGAPGARRGKDSDEDQERRTKYLKSEDLGKHWGATEPVAPPVIGDRR
jgi:hypothetical protein